MKHIAFFSAAAAFMMMSCNNNAANKADENCPLSYELIGGDTVNVLTRRGKEGKWVPTKINKLQDTTYYRNDTVIEKRP
ncbi:MAG: hypothetical protein JST26_04605 [Bacteroidetes bacterium]|nr:hypothetical protein [Bacteroidota bacterium]